MWISNYVSPLLKILFPPLNCLSTFVKNHVTINERVYFCTLNFVPLIHMSMPAPHCFNYCCFIVSFQIGKTKTSSFPPKKCFGYSESLTFPYKFYNQLLSFCKKVCCNFNRDCAESIDQCGMFLSLCKFQFLSNVL